MPRTIVVPLFPEVQSLDVTGPVEVFAAATRYMRTKGLSLPEYEIRTAGIDGAPVRTSSGLTLLPDVDLATVRADCDTILVPGGEETWDLHAEVVAWLRERHTSARRIASVCSGAFLLARAGLLDGRAATTHWACCERLAREHPAVRVRNGPISVRSGRVITSAGVTAGIDLALNLVEEDIDRTAALTVARWLVVYLRRHPGQAQVSAPLSAQLADREPIRLVQAWINENPDGDLSVDALANRAGLSPRHFTRAFTAELGMPPGRYITRVRVETARRLLEDTGLGVAEVADASGFGTAESLRRAFVQFLGLSPLRYRTAHHTPAH